MGRSTGAVHSTKSHKTTTKKRQNKTKNVPTQETAQELASKGEQLLEQGDFEEARKLFEMSLGKDPDPNVMFSMASCLLELSRPEEAKQYLRRSCEVSPDSQPDKWLSLAELEEGKESLRCLEKAVEILERELAKEPEPVAMDEDEAGVACEDKENLKKITSRKLSSVYVCISELFTTDLCDEPDAEARVVASIAKALELDPSNPEAVQAKAAYHLIKEEFDMAKQEMQRSLEMWLPAFERAVEGSLDDADQVPPFNVRLSAVKLLLELELYTEAVTILDGLVLEDEDSIDVWYLLGWTNFLRGGDYLCNAKFYLKKAAKVAAEYDCGEDAMVSHIEELLEELKEVNSEDEDEEGEEGEWTTDDDEDN